MLSKISNLGLMFAILFATSFSYGQLPVPFKVRYQSYVKGDMTVIANNIVNRKDYGNNPNMPYMNATKTAKLNDEFEMFYIDIDSDMSTFSSSAATLYLENEENKKIVYAGLYWSATYKYNSGIKTKRNKFKAFDKNREAFDQIKLKLPGESRYVDIKGNIIFDGLDKKGFDESAPYAVYADITDLVKQLGSPSGEYTVANIKATQGVIEGGVSGGWTMFFVFEDDNETAKFISSYDGFAGVTDKSTEILFTGFKTLPEGNVFAKLACAGLEGDNNLAGDQLQIKSQLSEIFTLLSSPLKLENNFFNSNIIINDQYFTDRNPNSKNTLGYDTSLITIGNPDNSVIQNNTDNVTLKLKTVGDRYFMFFNAFNVEVQDVDKEPVMIVSNNSNEIEAVEVTPIIAESVIADNTKPITTIVKNEIKPETITPSKEVIVAETAKVEVKVIEPIKKETIIVAKADTPKENTNNVVLAPKKEVVVSHPKVKTENNEVVASNTTNIDPVMISEKLSQVAQSQHGQKQKITAIPGPMVEIYNQQRGFYVIANVFAVHRNATRFVAKLRSLGIDANFFINPKNNYRYVFVSKNDSWSSALNLYYSNVNGKYFGDTWIMLVNTSPDQLVSNEQNIDYNDPFCPQQKMVATRSKEDELV
ncbi:hypothetical protein [uncultured Flavobacterium sp.]|uniref:hypothetical protein n=1 Tax=uncultured Flavobacterium sp. TaxID=165435 RepID=UPI0030EBEEC0|tara:strand:+ start:3209 stop:5149 length:1941 start_codon:yes stop_codon:yes gene_type:complete